MMGNWSKARSRAAAGLIILTILLQGCGGAYPGGGGQTTESVVIDEYTLTSAGFQKYKPNMETPRTQALLDALPSGQISTFHGDGKVYHAYPDKFGNVLYVGDQAAYDKYVAMAQGQKICRRVDNPDSSGFWGCYQELQSKGQVPRGN
jgi:hypothetical protein